MSLPKGMTNPGVSQFVTKKAKWTVKWILSELGKDSAAAKWSIPPKFNVPPRRYVSPGRLAHTKKQKLPGMKWKEAALNTEKIVESLKKRSRAQRAIQRERIYDKIHYWRKPF